MDEAPKKINISGTNNKYKMKQLINSHKLEKETKKRVLSEKWTFQEEHFEYSHQTKMVNDILNNSYKS
jgi:hypothetical protein